MDKFYQNQYRELDDYMVQDIPRVPLSKIIQSRYILSTIFNQAITKTFDPETMILMKHIGYKMIIYHLKQLE